MYSEIMEAGLTGRRGKMTGKKLVSLLLAIAILLMAGCGKQDGTEEAGGTGSGNDAVDRRSCRETDRTEKTP